MWLKSYGKRAPVNEDRIRAARFALRCRQDEAHEHRLKIKATDPYLAAALSGRRLAYQEAVLILDAVLDGRQMPKPKRVRRRERARIAAIRAVVPSPVDPETTTKEAE